MYNFIVHVVFIDIISELGLLSHRSLSTCTNE